MKRLFFVLALSLCAFAPVAMADAPVLLDDPSSLEAPVQSLDCAPASDDALGEAPAASNVAACEPELNCARYETAFCRYAWTCDGCCTPTYTAPGRVCFPICIR